MTTRRRDRRLSHLSKLVQIFLVEMLASEPTYKRECDLQTQTGGTPAWSRDQLWPRFGVTRTGTSIHSAATPLAGFSAVCRSGDHSNVVGSTQHAPVTALMRRVRANVEVACLRTTGGTSRKARPSNAREVTMTMREYEERFRPSAPPLHQTFAEVRRPSRGGRRSRRLWVMAALFGVMTITSKAALHHSSHANDWQISKAGIQACDFIHR